MAARLMGLRGYGRHRRTSVESVRRAIAAGRLAESITRDARGRVRIDPVVADLEWDANTTMQQVIARAVRKSRRLARTRAQATLLASIDHLSVSAWDREIVLLAYGCDGLGSDTVELIPMSAAVAGALGLRLLEAARESVQSRELKEERSDESN
jgi:hypothetical protein